MAQEAERELSPETPNQTQSGERAPRAIPVNPSEQENQQPEGQEMETITAPRAVEVDERAIRIYENWMVEGKTGRDGLPIDPGKPMKLILLSPRQDEVIASGTIDVFFDVENYLLAEGGNRIHVIIDNQSPRPYHDIVRPMTIKGLSEGGHCIRAYLVKPNGEMIRDKEAFVMRRFYIKRKDFQNYTDPRAPFLTVNLPLKGVVEADQEDRVCFDYLIHNVKDEEITNYKLRYLLDKHEGFLSEQGPVYWSNLKAGKHKLVVELFDKNDQPIFGAFNRVEFDFEVKRILRAQPVEEDTLMQELIEENQQQQ